MTRALRGLAVAAAAGLVGLLAFPGTASAHVTVSGDATQGSYARVTFNVPNESDTASTVKLEVFLPEGQPITSVSTRPIPGWTAVVTRKALDKPADDGHGGQITEAVSQVTWTADAGGGVKPGQYQEFAVSMGRLPAVDKLVFKALQTYSDNDIARWIEEPVAGGKEPDNPAPVLTLKKANAPDTAAAASEAPAGDTAARDDDGDDEGGEDGEAGIWLGAAGLVTGLAGLVLGGLAFARTRRTT